MSQPPSSISPLAEAILSSISLDNAILPLSNEPISTTVTTVKTEPTTDTNNNTAAPSLITPSPLNSNSTTSDALITQAIMSSLSQPPSQPQLSSTTTSSIKQEAEPSTFSTSTTGAKSNNSGRVLLQRNVPAFLNKLYSIVSDPSSDDLIRWSEDGSSFFVNQQDEFARKVLPRFFKHKKFSSFVRQLNMYGFHKVPHLQQGVLETDSESERWEFSNPHFQRNQPDLLLLVTRKKGQHTNDKDISNMDLHHILEEIQSIKKHQMNISTQLSNIQRDNQALWQETMSARERHQRHQETIDKILRFLASVFSNEKRPAISRKRRYLLGPGDHHDVMYDEDEEEEQSPPLKIQKHQTFDLNDLVQHESLDHIDLKQNNTSDLQEAIALNDKTKLDHNHIIPPQSTVPLMNTTSTSTINTPKTPTSAPLTSAATSTTSSSDAAAAAAAAALSIPNLTQIQGLQNLIALAQSNPELLNQLTNETFFSNNNNNNNNNNNSLTSYNSPSIDHVTANISHLTDSADALNQDIDDLGTSIEQLAQHLGFDSKSKQQQHEEEDEEDLLDIDEFLNTYDDQMELPPSTITDMPSNTTTRSPSPIITTPGSMTNKPQAS